MRKRIEEFIADLMVDRRKAILLGSLLIVAGGMWIRFGFRSGGPQSAQASTQPKLPGESAAALDDAFAELTKVREQLAAGIKTIRRAGYSDRDVFTLHTEHFPLLQSATATDQVDPKSPVVFVETPEERAAREKDSLIRRVTEEADRLKLRSTMVGSRLAAVIEATVDYKTVSEVLRPGQELEGFVLVEVHTDRVLLEKEGVMVEMFIHSPDEE